MRHLGLLLASFWCLVGCASSTPLTGGTRQLSERPAPATTIAPTQDATAMPEQTDIADVVTPETAVPATSTPEVTATPVPAISPAPSPTPLAMPASWSRIFYYELFWSVPSTWSPVMEALSASVPDGNLIYAVASSAEAPSLLAQSVPSIPQGLMLMTLRAGVEMPRPVDAVTVTVSGHPGWLFQASNLENTPFTRRWILFVQTPSNRYALSLECAPPDAANDEGQANYEDLCRRTWERMAAEFEVMDFSLQTECPVVDPVPTTIEWRRVSSQWHRYSFEVPGSWLELRGPTLDRLGFLSDPAVYNQLNICPLPNGLMKLDFSADPPGNFGTGEPGSAPDREGFTAITVAGHPAWMQASQGEEVMDSSATGTTVYIQGPQFWYHMWLRCMPPTGAGSDSQAEFQEQCDSVHDHILQSFQILTAE